MAAGAVNTARQLGFAFGVALLGSVFTARAGDAFGAAGAPGAGGHEAFASGLDAVNLVAGVSGLAAAAIVLVMLRRPAPAPSGAWVSRPDAPPLGATARR
jgi:hypothetical protein